MDDNSGPIGYGRFVPEAFCSHCVVIVKEDRNARKHNIEDEVDWLKDGF